MEESNNTLFKKGHFVPESWKEIFRLANKKRRKGIYKKCLVCNKEFYCSPKEKTKYCSFDCFKSTPKPWMKNRKPWNKNKHIKLNNALDIWRKNGGKPWNKNKKYALGEKHWHWKGGRVLTTDGYWEVYSPEHPYRNRFNKVREHRLIMEKKLGRYLESWEVVHHKNRDRQDNRLENLELLSEHEHCLLHKVEKWTKKRFWHINKEHCEEINH